MLQGMPGEEYDVLVVDGGSAGCALAARLAADRRVLLLEVVDPALRVHGLTGRRVADLSVLPVAPRRGTAATACAVGEAAAEFLAVRVAGGATCDRAGWST